MQTYPQTKFKKYIKKNTSRILSLATPLFLGIVAITFATTIGTNISTQDIDISGNATTTGNLNIGGNLAVVGDTTTTGIITVDNNGVGNRYSTYGSGGMYLRDTDIAGNTWDIIQYPDVAGALTQEDNDRGGFTIWGVSEDIITPLSLRGAFLTTDPNDSVAAVTLEGYKWNGTTHVAPLAATERVMKFNSYHDSMMEFLGDHSAYLNNSLNFMCTNPNAGGSPYSCS